MSTTNKQSARQEGETPRTDEVAGWIDAIDGTLRTTRQYEPSGRELPIRNYVRADFARTLERELSAKQAELESLKAAQGWIPEIVQKSAPAMKALRERLGKMTHDERQSLLESALTIAKQPPTGEENE